MSAPFSRIQKLTPGADRLRSELLNLDLPLGDRWGVAVSGGRDSMSLLAMLAELRQWTRWPKSLELEVWHVNHGRDPKNPSQTEFRDRAELLVKAWADRWGFSCRVFSVRPSGSSEEVLREARWAEFRRQNRPVWLAHHCEDLLETRLMRLMRGTGPCGLRSMSKWSEENRAVRAVLEWTPEQLHAGGEASAQVVTPDLEEFPFLLDPQNVSGHDSRARIRRELWPCFENVRPGSKAALARSLELMVEALDANSTEVRSNDAIVLNRSRLLLLSSPQAERSLHFWLTARGYSATRSQLGEVLKRLAQADRNFEFDVAGLAWSVRGDQVSVESLANPMRDQNL